MAESTEGRLNTLPALALEGLPLPEGGNAPLNENNDTDRILCQNTITNRIDWVSKASLGGGGGSAEMLTKTQAGSTVNLQFSDPIGESGTYLIPQSTTGGTKTLVASVNQVLANDGGVVFLGLQQILNQDGFVTDGTITIEDTGNGDISSLTGGQLTISQGSNSVEINKLGTQVLSGAESTIQRAGYFQFGADISNYTRLSYATPTASNMLSLPNKSGTIATLDDITGGGTVTEVTGLDGVNVATGTTTPVISLGNITPDSVRSLVQISNNANENYANLISNNLTSSKTIFLPNSPDNSVLATGISVNGGSPVYADTSGVLNVTVSSGGATNLTYTASPTNGIVNSDTGTDATIPLADTTNAGLLSPADFTKLGNLASNANGTYAPLASPAFTGTPTAPTAASASNDTTIASTAWVKSNANLATTGTSTTSTAQVAAGTSLGMNIYRLQNQVNLKAASVGTADIEITDATKGIILKDAGDATRRRITIVNGVITVSAPL